MSSFRGATVPLQLGSKQAERALPAHELDEGVDAYLKYAEETEFWRSRHLRRPCTPEPPAKYQGPPPPVIDLTADEEEQAAEDLLDTIPIYEPGNLEDPAELEEVELEDVTEGSGEPAESAPELEEAEEDDAHGTRRGLEARLRERVKRWQATLEKGHLPAGIPAEDKYVPGEPDSFMFC